MSAVTLPAGKYFVGDPCYVFSDKDWDRMIDEVMYPPHNDGCTTGSGYDGIYNFNGYSGWFNHTAHGDGGYFDSHGNEFGVDAGCIGATPIELTDPEKLADLDQLGLIKEFTKPFSCEYVDGTFYIGEHEIPTDFQHDEDDWSDLDDEDDLDDDVDEDDEY